MSPSLQTLCFLLLFTPLKTESKYLPRIVGGQTAIPHEFPFAALITDQWGLLVCGGTLISPRYVLTAAHCVHSKLASGLRVRLGEHDLNETLHVSVLVDEIIPHPKFNYFATTNDIALLKLHQIQTSVQSIRPVCLPPDESFDGARATVVGWGHLDDSGTQSRVLNKLEVVILEKRDCKERLETNRWWLSETKLCGWSLNKNACEGDSGGPVIITNTSIVIGVISFGVQCGTTNTPSIYTRISKYNQWILDNTTDNPPCTAQKTKK